MNGEKSNDENQLSIYYTTKTCHGRNYEMVAAMSTRFYCPKMAESVENYIKQSTVKKHKCMKEEICEKNK